MYNILLQLKYFITSYDTFYSYYKLRKNVFTNYGRYYKLCRYYKLRCSYKIRHNNMNIIT